jgi:hypothetical protein
MKNIPMDVLLKIQLLLLKNKYLKLSILILFTTYFSLLIFMNQSPYKAPLIVANSFIVIALFKGVQTLLKEKEILSKDKSKKELTFTSKSDTQK